MDGVWYKPGYTNRPNKKGIEYLVDSYLDVITTGNRLRQERKFLEKSIILINKILGHPCCDVSNGVIDFGTPNNNQITTSLENILFGGSIVRRSFRTALFRMLAKFNTYLYGCCTTLLTVTYQDVAPANATVNFTDIVSGDVLFSTKISGGNTQTIELPSQWFGPAALIRACITNINAPGSGSNKLNNGGSVIVSSSTIGSTCATSIGPLQTSYTITNS